MTRLPAPHRLAAADALALLRDNFASANIAATDAIATGLLTLNARDYDRLEPRLQVVGV